MYFLISNLIINCHDFYYIHKNIFSKPLRIIWCKCSIINKKRIRFSCAFLIDIFEIFSANIWWIIYCNLLKFSFVWNFWDKKMSSIQSNTYWNYDWVIKTREIFNFLPLINNSVTVEFSFWLWIISAIIWSKTINILFSLWRLY